MITFLITLISCDNISIPKDLVAYYFLPLPIQAMISHTKARYACRQGHDWQAVIPSVCGVPALAQKEPTHGSFDYEDRTARRDGLRYVD